MAVILNAWREIEIKPFFNKIIFSVCGSFWNERPIFIDFFIDIVEVADKISFDEILAAKNEL